MLIYNITFHVPNSIECEWLKWIKDTQIPFILESELLFDPQLTRILNDQQEEGKSYALQVKCNDMLTLTTWHKLHSANFQRNCTNAFGQQILFFATVLEIIK